MKLASFTTPELQTAALDRTAMGVTASGLMAFFAIGTHGDVRWMLAAGTVASAWATYRGDWPLLKMLVAVFPCYSTGFYLSIRALTYQPRRIDSTLMALDHGFAMAVWNWCSGHLWTHFVLVPVYYLVGAVIVAAVACSARRRALLAALAIAGTAAPLHLTIALLCWVYADRVKWVFGAFAALTAGATLGLGEHYAVDLLAATAFVALIVQIQNAVTASWRHRSIHHEISRATGQCTSIPEVTIPAV
jgi:hypothetical protein